MSTRINITIDSGGLLDRNAQQTAANRQAKVLADQRAAAEAEGVERRAADRIAAGLDPLTGLPASTPSSASAINRLNQEPAANRQNKGKGYLYYCPNTTTLEAAEITPGFANSNVYTILPVFSIGSGGKLIPRRKDIASVGDTRLELPVLAHLSAPSEPSLVFRDSAVYNQSWVKFLDSTEAQNRVEWTNLRGQFTFNDVDTAFIPLRVPQEVEYTVEADIYYPQLDNGQRNQFALDLRLWADINDTITYIDPSLIQDNTQCAFKFDNLPNTNSGFFSLSATVNFAKPSGTFFGFDDLVDFYLFRAGWNRYSLSYKNGRLYAHWNGNLMGAIDIPKETFNNKYQAVTLLADAETETIMPAISAVRFIEKCLYEGTNYTPSTLVGSFPVVDTAAVS
jgi:hypothetical protein